MQLELFEEDRGPLTYPLGISWDLIQFDWEQLDKSFQEWLNDSYVSKFEKENDDLLLQPFLRLRASRQTVGDRSTDSRSLEEIYPAPY